MRRVATRRWGALAAVTLGLALAGGASDAQAPATQPVAAAPAQTTWYFYTVQWGFQDEFLDLFQKNHYPVLKAMRDAGVYTSVRAYRPRYHGDGRADWTFAVELVRRENVAFDEPALIRRLFPDQETFRTEERRRFELLTAHWDVPLEPVDFDTRERSR